MSTFDTIVREFAAAPITEDAEEEHHAAAAAEADECDDLHLRPLHADADATAVDGVWADSVKRKRTKKMNKHKYKKRLKEQRRQSRKNSAQ